jgi:hypothetical protein
VFKTSSDYIINHGPTVLSLYGISYLLDIFCIVKMFDPVTVHVWGGYKKYALYIGFHCIISVLLILFLVLGNRIDAQVRKIL